MIKTIFQRNEIEEPVFFTPSDTTERISNFPKICVSTFSEKMMRNFRPYRIRKRLQSYILQME